MLKQDKLARLILKQGKIFGPLNLSKKNYLTHAGFEPGSLLKLSSAW